MTWPRDWMSLSKFKATCLAALERVRRTGRPPRVTRFGRPAANVVPPAVAAPTPGWLGGMRRTATVVGDIQEPSSELVSWTALE